MPPLLRSSSRTTRCRFCWRYEAAEEFTEASTEQALRAFAGEKGIKVGLLINGSRVALTGQGVAPSLFAVMVALGKERVVTRLKAAAEIVVVAQGLS